MSDPVRVGELLPAMWDELADHWQQAGRVEAAEKAREAAAAGRASPGGGSGRRSRPTRSSARASARRPLEGQAWLEENDPFAEPRPVMVEQKTPLQEFQTRQLELFASAWDELPEAELAAFALIALKMAERLAGRLTVREAERATRDAV